MYAGIGLGERAGRKPSRPRAGAVFHPRLRFKSYQEINDYLLDRCIGYARAHRHPELPDCTIWEAFEAGRPKLVPYAGCFDGFHAVSASVSKTCLVRFDNHKYSVSAEAFGRPVEVHAYAERLVIRQDGVSNDDKCPLNAEVKCPPKLSMLSACDQHVEGRHAQTGGLDGYTGKG